MGRHDLRVGVLESRLWSDVVGIADSSVSENNNLGYDNFICLFKKN